MKILCIGDIVGRPGRDMLTGYLDDLKYQKQIDFVIANGENSAHGRGMTYRVYEELCTLGVDAFTLGNHTWGCKDILPLLDTESNIVRPANFDDACPGKGSRIVRAQNGVKIGIINLIGQTYMQPCNSPFRCVDHELTKIKDSADLIFVDFHAEATSEKIAMGWYLDGRVSAVFGTHTHVQTADETILPKNTAYITDLGMTGSLNSVLGMEKSVIINRFLTGIPQKFELASGRNCFSGCIFEIDEKSANAVGIERIQIRE